MCDGHKATERETMKTLALASLKGGTGKSTIAAHLAVQAVTAGERVVVLDLDAQASLAEWYNVREAEAPAYARATLDGIAQTAATLAASGQYSLAIIDTPATDKRALRAALAVCDAVLMPVRPSPNDLRAAPDTVAEIEASGKPFAFVLSQRVARTKISEQAVIALANLQRVSPAVIGSRTSYASAMIDGRTAQEIDPTGPAAEEIAGLWKFARGMLK